MDCTNHKLEKTHKIFYIGREQRAVAESPGLFDLATHNPSIGATRRVSFSKIFRKMAKEDFFLLRVSKCWMQRGKRISF